ncbi:MULTISPECIES: hypothetical protein [Aeromonas]|uniref:Phage protein n=1 Tax=Aeromonas salmonicida TaxID=645 RepID=A0AAX1PFR3_AERSA|nr:MULTISPECIES: hypothetical protein [Aeromonas]MCE9936300.1 hypothetical protein [Aeromonas salmonicida]RAI97827.1 hypothetical protein DEU50_13325 [Aeromonas salmonicida]GJA77864.1 hypothetical protein KAM354_31000 [Aeromonas caviae]
MKRKPKYSESWRERAANLQIKIEAAILLAAAYPGDESWLYRTHNWVCEVAEGHAPEWWSDLDCEAVLPREEKRVHLFTEAQMMRGRSHKLVALSVTP